MRRQIIAAVCLIAQSGGLLSGAYAQSESGPTDVGVVRQSPALQVTSVEIIRFQKEADGGVVLVKALTTPGQQAPLSLVPLSRGPTSDNILDLAALAPISVSNYEDKLVQQEARFIFAGDIAQIKGVRVRSATNVVESNSSHETIDNRIAEDVTKMLVGKKISRNKMQIMADSVPVISTDAARIVKADQPIPDLTVNPARLTIYVSKEEIALYARWN